MTPPENFITFLADDIANILSEPAASLTFKNENYRWRAMQIIMENRQRCIRFL